MTEHQQPRATAHDHFAFWMENLALKSFRAGESIAYQGGFVYVIQGEPGSPVKIGYADSPRTRLRALQTANPEPLHLLYVIPGNKNTERLLHLRFRDARLQGEWFGGDHLQAVLALFANLADRMVEAYDGGPLPPSVGPDLELRPPSMESALRRNAEVNDERMASFERYRDVLKQVRTKART